MREGLEKYLRKYSEVARELRVNSLDANMTDLLSACKNTTRLFIALDGIGPEAALVLGEKFPRLSHLELCYANSAIVSYLSPLTRKVQTLYYRPQICRDSREFMYYYKDFDCPLVTHLIIDEQWDLARQDFPHIIQRFPALKTLEYTGPFFGDYLFDYFVYDAENMVFKEIRFLLDISCRVHIRFRDDIPSKTPVLPSVKKVTHESQFHALQAIDRRSLYGYIPQFTYVDAVHLFAASRGQEDFVRYLLNLKDIRYLRFHSELQDLPPHLCKETFKATTVFLEVIEPNLPVVLELLATCFPNLQELGIDLIALEDNYDPYDYYETGESKMAFTFWEKLVESCPNLSKIHLSDEVPFRCQVGKEYPHILVDNKCQGPYF
ncbi:hypothetical protein DSO57_1024014 [Entomophthora muscae]|uniref:Uncharacterized protein n=1 Tax=Entomophthora muscae TaxID=34485 RepID=A0ACC2SRZ7_9FUNG|nr:hypothetical protein DSO57_1024014 [Entomophthora muscae]